jgi:uncharacterized protein (TIGR03437 family)
MLSSRKTVTRDRCFGENHLMNLKLRYLLVAIAPLWAQTAVSPTLNSLPTREFGQASLQSSLNSIAPNLVEGRELYNPYGVAFDTSVSPPILYVVDTLNNRVLAWQNPTALGVCGLNNPNCGFATKAIGQRDMVSTLAGGPGTNGGLTAGFNGPTSIAVDTKGNLYVADNGNNRILRFPRPFSQTGALLTTDLVIGQASVASGTQGNQGLSAPSAQTLSLGGDQLGRTGLVIEPASGALWVTDTGNNRVLRFPANQLSANTSLPTADLVIGQSVFTSGTLPPAPSGTQSNNLVTTFTYLPNGVTFDQAGNLYVSDNFNRVLFYSPPFSINMSASRILGIAVQLTSTPLTFPNNYGLSAPSGLFTQGNNLFVADTGNNRVVEYDAAANWPAAGNPFGTPAQEVSPPIIAVIGQNDLNNGKVNKNQGKPDNSTLAVPIGGAFNGTDLWVADTANNRVMQFTALGGKYVTASRVVGQLDYGYNAPNLIEGREVFFAGAGVSGQAGLAIDHNSNPPHLYIADTFNNRILCFKDYRSVQQGSQVDIVLGQPDVFTSLPNSGVPNQMTQQGLSAPTGLMVDVNGNLYVADSGNGRVLRYPAPFSVAAGGQQLPNLVLGQSSFSGTPITDVSVQNMHTPYGLVLFQGCFAANQSCSLAVSDSFHNRVLIFKRAAGTDFQNGQPASIVLGQQGFNNQTTSNATNGMNSPRHLSADSSDRLYVCDSGNNRVLIFANAPNAAVGQGSSLQLTGFSSPQGVVVSQRTGEAWVTNTGGATVQRFPSFENLILSQTPNDTVQLQTQTLAVTLDNTGNNIIVAESANRITFFYPQLAWQNSANYNSNPIAPGMLALLYQMGLEFNFTSTPSQSLPLPPTVNDIQVQVNGVPAPIYRIDPIDIAFQVPQATALGTASVVVLHPSTGEIIASASIPVNQYAPGFYASGNPAGTGQAAATNDDGSINSQNNPISRDGTHFVTFYLTGGGAFPGLPDGQVPASGTTISTQDQPQILSTTFAPLGIAPQKDVLYSGTSFYPGVWQVNFKVESIFGPGKQVVAVVIGSYVSSQGPSGTIQVYFYTK